MHASEKEEDEEWRAGFERHSASRYSSTFMASIGSIIYGTAWKKEETTRLVVAAFKAGFRSIDTAGQPKHYREELVGDALHALYEGGIVKRAEIWIQTKYAAVA